MTVTPDIIFDYIYFVIKIINPIAMSILNFY